MKMVEGGGFRRQTPKKLTLESYLDFIQSQKPLHLTISQLNQIIDMHGFKKVHRANKSDLMEAVKIMELMDPSRSTLEETGLSSEAFIPLDDLIMDINELQWQECRVTSLQTINAEDHDNLLEHQISNNESTALTVASASSKKSIRPRKKPKKLADNGTGGDLSSNCFDFRCSQRTLCSPLVTKLVPRKKTLVKYNVHLNSIDNHGDGSLGGSAVCATDLQPLSSSSSAFLPLGS